MLQSLKVWDKAHYTQNDSNALKDGAQRRVMTQHKYKRKALRRGKQGLIMC